MAASPLGAGGSTLLSSGVRVHAIQTGTVQIHPAQVAGRGRGLRRRATTLLERGWTEPLPILAWAIEHPEGLIVVDTGETARASEPGYLPRLHPYFRLAVRLQVRPQEEIGPQLRERGLDPLAARLLILTHLHTDHAGGLAHFIPDPAAATAGRPPDGVPALVDAAELRTARGLGGRLRGYLPHRWPAGFAPRPVDWRTTPLGPFPRSLPLTAAGDVIAIPTPGHTPGHLSVVVGDGERQLLLAGDVAYTQELLASGTLDGVAPDDALAHQTGAQLRALIAATPTVVLPTHDPGSVARLERYAVAAG